ncbi:MAG: PilN domain-containing protein [Hyphomicrobiales bacterium]|nr:PilN domain-containing protein [Hyphomicrobiales bacterium]MBV8662645.1 PilN domain-containing protein [Hyphomicrobiales bacterium]
MNLATARSWIGGELGSAAAAFAAGADAVQRPRRVTLVECDNGDFALAPQGGGEGGAVRLRLSDGDLFAVEGAAPRLAGADVEVALAARRFVYREVELPRQAGAFLAGVIRAQIDRLTPWTAREAVFGCAAPRPLGADRILVTVAAAPRASIAALTQALEAARVRSWTIAAPANGDEPGEARVVIASARPAAVEREGAIRRALGVALALAAFAAVLSGLASVWLGSDIAAQSDALRHEIAARRAALTGGGGAQQKAMAMIDAKKRGAPASVLVLEALARALPDNTYLTELHVEGAKVHLAGLTEDAPALIRLIEQSPSFKHAAFDAPTMQTQGERGERFHIAAHADPVFTVQP